MDSTKTYCGRCGKDLDEVWAQECWTHYSGHLRFMPIKYQWKDHNAAKRTTFNFVLCGDCCDSLANWIETPKGGK